MSLLQKAGPLSKSMPRLLKSEKDKTEGTKNSVGTNNSGQTSSNLNNINDKKSNSNDRNVNSKKNATDFTRNIRAVFKCFRTAGLKLTKQTCHFGVRQVEFVGPTISPE